MEGLGSLNLELFFSMYGYPEVRRVGCLAGSKIITSLQFIQVTTILERCNEILKNAFEKAPDSTKEMENVILSTPKK